MYLSSKVDLFEGAELNIRPEGQNGKTASLQRIQAYDTLSEISRKSVNLSGQAVVEWRSIVQRAHACGSMV